MSDQADPASDQADPADAEQASPTGPDADTSASAPPKRRRRRRPRAPTPPDFRGIARAILMAAGLTLATIVVFTQLPRYALPGEPILANPDFRTGFEAWEIEGLISLDETELGRAILLNRDPGRSAYLRQRVRVPNGATALRLQASLATSQVLRGEEDWQSARIYLVQQTRFGDSLWNQPHQLVQVIGTTSRQLYETTFAIPSSIPQVLLGIELSRATGRIEVADLGLEMVEELPGFRLVASLVVAGWCLLGFWVAVRLYRAIRSPTIRVWLLGVVAVLGIGLFMPAVARQQLIDALARGFGFQFAEPDAIGHALVFALLAFLLKTDRRQDPLALHLSCWILVAAVTEVLQLMTADRDPEIGDWLVDALGATIGVIVAELAGRMQSRFEPAGGRGPPPGSRPGGDP